MLKEWVFIRVEGIPRMLADILAVAVAEGRTTGFVVMICQKDVYPNDFLNIDFRTPSVYAILIGKSPGFIAMVMPEGCVSK